MYGFMGVCIRWCMCVKLELSLKVECRVGWVWYGRVEWGRVKWGRVGLVGWSGVWWSGVGYDRVG